MAKSVMLFELIKSLSKSEKRYFKLYHRLQEGEKNYILLFDYIDKMSVYDEDLVLKKFAGNGFTRQLHVTKNYLYNQILKSLRAYYADRRIESKAIRYFENAAILQERGLDDQSFKWLEKTEKLAWKYELYGILAQVYAQKLYQLLKRQSKGVEEVIEEQYHLSRKVSLAIMQEGEYLFSTAKVFVNFRKMGDARLRDEVKQKLERIFASDLMQNENAADSFKSKYMFYYSWMIYYRVFKGDVQNAFKYGQSLINVWEKNPMMIKEYPKRYKVYLHNYLTICMNAKKYDEFTRRLEEMRLLPSKSFDEEAENFQNTYHLELLYCLNSVQFDRALGLVADIEQGLKKYAHKINKARQIAFFYNISVLYFLTGRFLDAQTWINKLLTGRRNDPRRDMQRFARILQLILFYELGSFRVIENMQESVYRDLQRKKQLDQLERIVLKGIEKLIYSPDQRDKLAIFESMQEDIEQLENQFLTGLEEIMIWIESKLEEISCEEVLRRREGGSSQGT